MMTDKQDVEKARKIAVEALNEATKAMKHAEGMLTMAERAVKLARQAEVTR